MKYEPLLELNFFNFQKISIFHPNNGFLFQKFSRCIFNVFYKNFQCTFA